MADDDNIVPFEPGKRRKGGNGGTGGGSARTSTKRAGRYSAVLAELERDPLLVDLVAFDSCSRIPMLMPPRPLVGYHNGALASAHLKAAMQEGTQDVESLAAVFGR